MIYTFITNIINIFVNYWESLIDILNSFLGGIIIAFIGASLILILVKFILTKGGL